MAVYRLSPSSQTSLILVLIITSNPPIKAHQLTFSFLQALQYKVFQYLGVRDPLEISLASVEALLKLC